MKHMICFVVICTALLGCTKAPFSTPKPQVDMAPAEGQLRPMARPSALDTTTSVTAAKPPTGARTQEQFDTTTAAERVAAAEVPAAPTEKSLGATIASLGDPTDPGFWMETPLVSAVTQGRLEYPGTGKSVQVELRPIAGPSGAGSRVSLPAFRVLEAPLTALPELLVFASG